jgi:hypothetical protein
MANEISFEELKHDSGDLKKLDDSSLESLSVLIQKLLDKQIIVEEIELTLKEQKREVEILSSETIPLKMQEMGITSTQMEDGSKVSYKDEFFCRIPKDRAEDALNYLRDKGLGDIIKNQVSTSFGSGEDNMAGDLAGYIQQNYGVTPDVKESVHPSTLKASLKRRQEEGISDPEDLFGIFIRPVTKVTKGKK